MQVAALDGIPANRYTIIVPGIDTTIGIGNRIVTDHKPCGGTAGVAAGDVNGMPAPIDKGTVHDLKACCINLVAIDQWIVMGSAPLIAQEPAAVDRDTVYHTD